MKRENTPWRPDFKDQAKEDFNQVKDKPIEKKFGEKTESHLEKWTKPKLELKPDGPTREAVDTKLYTADWHADIDAAKEATVSPTESAEKSEAEHSFSDLSGAEMEKLFLESFTRAASMDQGSGFER